MEDVSCKFIIVEMKQVITHLPSLPSTGAKNLSFGEFKECFFFFRFLSSFLPTPEFGSPFLR